MYGFITNTDKLAVKFREDTKTPLPRTHLCYLKFTQSDLGQENVLMWFFKKKLGYQVLNPCKLLKVIHKHCANIRPADRIRHLTIYSMIMVPMKTVTLQIL